MAKTTTKTPAAKPAKPVKAPKAAKAKPAATGPLSKVKALYGSKDKLVDKIAGALVHDGNDEGSIKERLATASNAQLLRLAAVAETVKKAYGSRDKLIDSLTKTVGRAKDKDFVAKLGTFTLPKLYDLAKAAERKAKSVAKKA
jgi:hypothetical protein